MHHIATIIFPTAPAPSVDELMDLLTSEFPDLEINEAEDGFEVELDDGTLFVEMELPMGSVRRGEDAFEDGDDDDDDDLVSEGVDGEEGDEDGEEEEEEDPEEDDEDDAPGAASTGAADEVVEVTEAALMLHFEGDFDDLAEVIGILEILISAASDATAVDADGEPFPLPEH